jgi:hypothetical protein
MAYVVLHYEVEPIGKRPTNGSYGIHSVPDLGASIRIRRLKAT